ncbi:hypothetical protein N0V90_007667 [Kalmusia sp. IMI 367209]|nr:hypothetical protein N0V90_007667 [Kalmusia sp. IMI 367209]
MAIIGSPEPVGLVGIKSLATKNKITDTVVPIWDLAEASSKAPENAQSFKAVNPGQESVVGGDERVLVRPQDIAPGGKYRSIVKIFSWFKKTNGELVPMHGTGWLIRPDLMVTAGHCVFDWGHSLGPVVQIQAYVGYNGKDSVTDLKAKVQFRTGKRVATTLEWVTAKGQRKFDVGFVQLDAPFTNVTPWKFDETPLSGSYKLGVVGYPGDLSDPKTKEMGAQMYEMYLNTNYHLAESHLQMIQYEIDTAGGNSGSPVIRESDSVAIGVHVYGGEPNSASVIGQYGNPFLDYIAAFDLRAQNAPAPTVNFSTGVPCHYYTVPTSKTPDVIKKPVDLTSGAFSNFTTQQGFGQTGLQPSSAKSFARPTEASRRKAIDGTIVRQASKTTMGLATSNGHSIDEEGFLDIFKSAIKIGGPILSAVGGPIGGLASVALSAAGNVAHAFGAEGALDMPNQQVAPEGTVERAIVAEAALRALLEMDHQTLEEEGFLDDIKSVVLKVAPVVRQAAPKILEVVGPAALQLAIGALKRPTNAAEGGFEFDLPKKQTVHLLDLPNTGTDAFVARLTAATEADAEGFLDGLGGFFKSAGSFVGKAIKTAGPVLVDVAAAGLPRLLGGAESGVADPDPSPMKAMDGVWQRAVVAEAALQAVLKAPQDVLEEEGFFGDLAKHIKNVAPLVIKHAPSVIAAVKPIVKNLSGHQESSLVIERPRTPLRTLRKARSGAQLRNSSQLRSSYANDNADNNQKTKGVWSAAQDLHHEGAEGGFNLLNIVDINW